MRVRLRSSARSWATRTTGCGPSPTCTTSTSRRVWCCRYCCRRSAEKNPGFQELLRNTVTGLAAVANLGNATALSALFEVGVPSNDPARARIALGVGTVAIRNTPAMLSFLETSANRDGAIDLIAEGF